MNNDHDKTRCWHCRRNHEFMTVKCASDVMGRTPKAIYGNEGRHFQLIKDGSVFLHRKQVEAHMQVLLTKGICKGECKAVFETTELKLVKHA